MNILINALIALSLTFGSIAVVKNQPKETSDTTTTQTIVNDDHCGM